MQTDAEYTYARLPPECAIQPFKSLKWELRPSEKAKLNFCGKLLHKMGDFNIMTQNSISINNFGMEFVI